MLAPPQRLALAQRTRRQLPAATFSKKQISEKIARASSSTPKPAAASFSAGNLVVYRVGTGAAALNNASTAVFLDEYTPSGTLVQSIPLPTADSGANQTLTAAGNATSEGLLTRSTDGSYIVLTGYDVAPGTASVAGTASATVPASSGASTPRARSTRPRRSPTPALSIPATSAASPATTAITFG